MIFIKGNVPSSKNSKIWTGKHLIWSKTANKYVKDTKEEWEYRKIRFQNEVLIQCNNTYPIKVSFKFIRGSKHKFDYINPLQTILDLMVKYEWIPDDNADIIIPYFEPYSYDKVNPGVEIRILN